MITHSMKKHKTLFFILLLAVWSVQVGCDQEGNSDDENSGDGDSDTDSDGDSDGDTDTDADGDADGDSDADTDADSDGDTDGDSDTDADGDTDGDTDGDSDGDTDGDTDGDADGDSDSDTDSDSDDIGPFECIDGFLDVCTPIVNYTNDEADGDGAEFDNVFPQGGDAAMQNAACTVCSILYRDPAEASEGPSTINLHIYDFDGIANAGGNTINISSRHIRNFQGDAALLEFTGVLVHECVHLYQNDHGEGGMVEGMADFVRIRAGLYPPGRRRPGGNWYDAYTTGGFFFSWLAGPGLLYDDGFEPKDLDIGWAINQKMGTTWDRQLFIDRLGLDVDALWDQYQAEISKQPYDILTVDYEY